MRRLRKVISGPLLTSAMILMLCACASATTASVVGPTRCLPRGARSLTADRTARVFSWHGSVYGCIDATGARTNLGGAGTCLARPGRAAPVTLAGEIVAYGLETCGVDTGSSTILVLSLASGKSLADQPAGTLPRRPESYLSVESIVLRGDGAVGWIARDESIVGHGPGTYEVHRFTGGKSSLLDSGPAIHPASLRLAGSRMSWRDGNATRSASLN